MASYSSSGAAVSWNDSLLPGMGGVSAPAPVAVSPAPLPLVVSAVVAVSSSPCRAVVSRVARAPGLPMRGASTVRAVVSLWAWRAISSSVST